MDDNLSRKPEQLEPETSYHPEDANPEITRIIYSPEGWEALLIKSTNELMQTGAKIGEITASIEKSANWRELAQAFSLNCAVINRGRSSIGIEESTNAEAAENPDGYAVYQDFLSGWISYMDNHMPGSRLNTNPQGELAFSPDVYRHMSEYLSTNVVNLARIWGDPHAVNGNFDYKNAVTVTDSYMTPASKKIIEYNLDDARQSLAGFSENIRTQDRKPKTGAPTRKEIYMGAMHNFNPSQTNESIRTAIIMMEAALAIVTDARTQGATELTNTEKNPAILPLSLQALRQNTFVRNYPEPGQLLLDSVYPGVYLRERGVRIA